MDRRLRVLVVSNMYPTVESPAFGSFVRGQVEALRATGEIDVDVFAFDARRRPWRYVSTGLRLAGLPPGVDIIHAHYGLSGFACLAAPRGLPLVLTVHGRDCHHPAVRQLTRLAARRANATVAVSRELAAQCPFPVADVIPPGVDLDLFRPLPRAEARRRLGLDAARRLVLFPADPSRPEKRHELAKALVDTLNRKRASDGPRPAQTAQAAAVATTTATAGATATVGAANDPAAADAVELLTLSGRPREEVPLWINAADAVVVTSEREGYGLACVEALACNVAVLSTPVGIARELLPGLDGALCARFDLDAWTAHLQRLLADADPRVAGRPRAETQGLPFVARRLIALYRRLLGGAGAGETPPA